MAKKKTRKRRKLLIFGSILVVIVALGAAAFLRKPDAAVVVQTRKVERRDLTEVVVANGRIQPVQEVKISAEVSGEIIELPVKEGQAVKQGDLLVRIKPDTYEASVKSAEANYQSALASESNSEANLRRSKLEYERNRDLFENHLISELDFQAIWTSYEIARTQVEVAGHQVDVAKAALDRAKEELAKTTITAPMSGTISKLNSELGERVVGTAMMTGTEIMILADLNQMEAIVDIGEIDVVLVQPGQRATLEVDAFRDREFRGTVTEIANSAKTGPGGAGQEAVKFEVKIRVDDREAFRPGMSVTAEIETRSRTNVLTVPIQSVTTRPPKPKAPPDSPDAGTGDRVAKADASAADQESTNAPPAGPAPGQAAAAGNTNIAARTAEDDSVESSDEERASAKPDAKSGKSGRKRGKSARAIEVVFVVEGDHVRMVPVKRGISDADYTEIVEGLEEGMEVVSGGYRAISRDLQDGAKIRRGGPGLSGDLGPGAKKP